MSNNKSKINSDKTNTKGKGQRKTSDEATFHSVVEPLKSVGELIDVNKAFMEKAGPGCKTAEGVAIHRFTESQRAEGERICFDPYAVYFLSPEILEFRARSPDKAKAMHERYEHFLPGLGNSMKARVRYFDDFVKESIDNGLEQLIILGAGYDSRAYRIEGLKNIRVFEVDHPATQNLKIEKIKKIFGSLPDHVVYVPVDLGVEELGQRLVEREYDKSKKSLFLMEGVAYYILPKNVDEILSFIVKNSGNGSGILFDYFPQSVVDGSSEMEVGRNIHNHLVQLGEPLQFGIKEGTAEDFLTQRGYSQVSNVTSEDYKRAYFHGINKNREVCSLMFFVHAKIECA
jgi:methyltransferase (TIGR00027 family)